ncbi:hypothetical protein SS50377_24871 [Spironucleus salmonicida]|uniref:Ubiquitin-like domain-containing protein n=1 Tax=Spironucleus salmonicida TaxID=348837 RepID=V6LVF3_9EUKA|nr:hypothetical protein SS50377_24871 [Spironucleus salmonicida]|eukprot:EST44784.1 Hypothetical protein SS50377_15319 [Spironucleus salmonicida]
MKVYVTLDDITKEIDLADNKNQVESAKKVIAKHFKVSWIRQRLFKEDGTEVKNDDFLNEGDDLKMKAVDKDIAIKEQMEEVYEYEEVYYYDDESESASQYDQYDDDDSDDEEGDESSDNAHRAADM